MTVVADFVIPPEAIPGGETLNEFPQARIHLERIIPADDRALPFFWLFEVDPELFLEQAKHEPEIDEIRILAEVDYGALFEAHWAPNAEVIRGIKQLQATILEATGSASEWIFQVRAIDRERLAAFEKIFGDQGIPVSIRRIYNFAELVELERPLTPEQREILVAAYEEGYFNQPRQISQEDLGEEFDISGRAVSARLTRGTRNLIASTILESDGN